MARGESRPGGRTDKLTDRVDERRVLDGLAGAVREGRSQVLVLLGEPGVGKTVLLDYLSEQVTGCQVARVSGVQSEMELAFAGVHQLCAPLLDHLDAIPAPQRDALRTAFGISPGPPPDQFLIGLAVLSLLSEAAGQQPLLCLIDDHQWLDQASALTLGFVARRLAADRVALVFAARVPSDELTGLPTLVVDGLREPDARALLDSALVGTLDPRVKELIVAEARGNPLALLELPRGLTAEQLAGGFGLPRAVPLAGRIEDSFLRTLDALPAQARRLVQVAAAEPSGDPFLVWRAAERLGIPAGSEEPAEEAGLVEFGARVRFRHPLVRSAAYRSTLPDDRRVIHAALAEAIDPRSNPDCRAWHRAAAAAWPDEEIAAELERSAGRAQARGGLAAAAAFLERAVRLTPDSGRRAVRAIAAAAAKYQAGAPDMAAELLALAEAGPLTELDRARISQLRGQMAFTAGKTADTPGLLLDAARRFQAVDAPLARETCLEALSAALLGHRTAEIGTREIALVSRHATAEFSDGGRVPDLLLNGMTSLVLDGFEAGAPAVRRALTAFRTGDLPADEQLRWLLVATHSAIDVWDDESWRELSIRQVELAREAGALSLLPFALAQRIGMHQHAGELAMASQLTDELSVLLQVTTTGLPNFGEMTMAAFLGRTQEALSRINAYLSEVTARGQGYGESIAHYTAAVMYNGLARYEDALASAELAAAHPEELAYANIALPELIEAAARSGKPERASVALTRLAQLTQPSGTGWGLGIEARSRALLSEGAEAERLYLAAIDHLRSAPARAELARAHLLYGEWLRHERRRDDARAQLRIAYDMTEAMGMGAFADRVQRELVATGESVRARQVREPLLRDAGEPLTAQEAQVALLARDGLSNAQIGTRLFISPRTVQYHLGKVFAKLGISSRSQLHRVLPADLDTALVR